MRLSIEAFEVAIDIESDTVDIKLVSAHHREKIIITLLSAQEKNIREYHSRNMGSHPGQCVIVAYEATELMCL